MTAREPKQVLVSVGTDFHAFDRLVEWMDEWQSRHEADRSRCFVQYGSSRPPALCEGAAFLDNDELDAAMERADAVVCHGGPGTISEARRHGHLPIVVPRSPALREHVDAHQERFVDHEAARGLLIRADTLDELVVALDLSLATPRGVRPEVDRGPDAAVARLGELLDQRLFGGRDRAARRGRLLRGRS